MIGFAMRAGWLDEITAWFKRQFEALWNALIQFFQDAFAWVLEGVLELFATAIEAIPVPSFLENGLGTLFANLDPSVLYFVGLFRIPEGLTILAAGVGFRLLRKLFTLGQW
jgi:hydrogenase-4 membrane subunit HyfE